MVFGYIRVSTDKQDTENQKIGIIEKATQLGLTIDEWVSDDGVSGAKEPEKRLLGPLLKKVQKGDTIIVSEISRIGRTLFMVFRILEKLLEKEVCMYSVKDAYALDNTITSKVLAFAFGMAAEIERDMIRKRTKEGLERRKREGVILGRPIGSRSERLMDDKREMLQQYLDAGLKTVQIARIFDCHRLTVANAIKEWRLKEPAEQLPAQSRKKHLPKLRSLRHQIEMLVEDGVRINNIRAWIIDHENYTASDAAIKEYFIIDGLWPRYYEIQESIRSKANINCQQHKKSA